MVSLVLGLLLAAQAAAAPGKDARAVLSEHPFGVRKGMSKADLEKALGGPLVAADAGLGVYEGAPLPHAGLKLYLYMHSARTGLCGVGAISPAIGEAAPATAGAALLQAFDALTSEIEASFGKPKTLDRPKKLDSADMQGGKVDLRADWLMESKDHPAPGDVASISVWVLPKPPLAMLRIIFRFANGSAAFRSGNGNSCD